MNALRAYLAAAAIALVGIAGAGAASAKPVLPAKLVLKLCHPHNETKVRYVGIKKIGHKYYRVYRITKIHVARHCHRHVIGVSYRYVPLPFFFKKHAPAA